VEAAQAARPHPDSKPHPPQADSRAQQEKEKSHPNN
jgi:hypothetical protein